MGVQRSTCPVRGKPVSGASFALGPKMRVNVSQAGEPGKSISVERESHGKDTQRDRQGRPVNMVREGDLGVRPRMAGGAVPSPGQ